MMPNPELLTAAKTYRPLRELIPARWHEGTIQAADGTPLHYWRTGADGKPALLLLHGFQGAGLMWLRQAKALEGEYDVVMSDFRGHGASGGVEHGFTLDLLTRDSAEVIRALKLQRPFVIGHSLGAEIAGRLAADAPELVRALVLVDPALRPMPPQPQTSGEPPAWMQQLFATMRALKTQTHTEKMVTGAGLMAPGMGLFDEEDYVTLVEAAAQFNHDVFPLMGAMSDAGLVDSAWLPRIDAPLLLMLGETQFFRPHDAATLEQLRHTWKRGELMQFPNVGHFIHVDAFEAWLEAARAFMAKS